MGEHFAPGWNCVVNCEIPNEEKPELSSVCISQNDNEGEAVFKQDAGNSDIVRSRCHVESLFGSGGLKRNADLASLPLIGRPSGGKDRHSKVYTAKGPRDRRVRLSVPAAIQFYDIQDKLGYDQPSKAVDWLMKKAKTAIDKLPQPHFDQTPNTSCVNTRQAINCYPAPALPAYKLGSSSFHAQSFADQQFVDLNLTVPSTSTIANSSVGQLRLPSYTIASTSSEPERMIQNSVLGISTDSLGQHMSISDSGEVSNLQGYPLARTDTRTKSRERATARERANERISVKLEPALLGSCNILVTEPAKCNPETFSSLSSMYNQIFASPFSNENLITGSILEEYETHQQNQTDFLVQDQAGQSFLNDSQEMPSTFQGSTNNSILGYARPSCQVRNSPLSDVSAEVRSRSGAAFFHEQLARDTSQRYNPLLDILTRASLQTCNSLSFVHTDSQEFYTNTSRSLSFLAPFSRTHVPSSSYSAAQSVSDFQTTASRNPLNNDVIKSVLTENNESCLSFFNPPQSTVQPTSHVVVGGYQGRYSEFLVSSPKFARSPQKLSSTEYDPLEDMLITSQGVVAAPQTIFNLAPGTLQDQIFQSISGQFKYSSAASPRNSPDANTYDLYEKDSRVISNADSFTPYGTPERSKVDGTFEIEEQSKQFF